MIFLTGKFLVDDGQMRSPAGHAHYHPGNTDAGPAEAGRLGGAAPLFVPIFFFCMHVTHRTLPPLLAPLKNQSHPGAIHTIWPAVYLQPIVTGHESESIHGSSRPIVVKNASTCKFQELLVDILIYFSINWLWF